MLASMIYTLKYAYIRRIYMTPTLDLALHVQLPAQQLHQGIQYLSVQV